MPRPPIGCRWPLVPRRRPNGLPERLAALLEPLGHIAWDTEGVGEFPYPDAVAEWSGSGFVAAVEAEDETAAIARIRGGLARGLTYTSMRAAISKAALAHYAGFGHCAIYTLKAGQLIERLGDAIAKPVLLALTRMLVRARREERLPEFRGYGTALAEWDGTGQTAVRAQDFIGLSVGGALRRTLASSARPMRELYDALLGAAAFNLLHFDTTFESASDNVIADNVSWLDFTHALTFANACRTSSMSVPICGRAPRCNWLCFSDATGNTCARRLMRGSGMSMTAAPFSATRQKRFTITAFPNRSLPVIA
jgi:hypothetical protein